MNTVVVESQADRRDVRSRVAVASLVVGPALMSVGDLLHPQERIDVADQATIIVAHASRWYAAHLLLLFGMLLLVPGVLAITRLVADVDARKGYAARVLVLIGMAAFTAVFGGETLVGKFAADRAGVAATGDLLRSLQSTLAIVGIGGLAFYAGIGTLVTTFVRGHNPLRIPTLLYGLGALLILAEIASSQVLFSQIGNVILLVANVGFARHILRSAGTP